MDTTAFVNTRTAVLSSDNPAYVVRLTHPGTVIPKNADITRTHLSFFDGLAEVHVVLGNQCVAFFDSDLESKLRTFPILTSLCTHMNVELRLVFCRKWLAAREEVAYEEEVCEVETRGSPCEFFNGNEYCWGEPVVRTRVPTGNKVRVVKKGVEVEIPAIRFELEFRDPPALGWINMMETPSHHKISLLGKDDAEMAWLTDRHGLVVRNGYGVVNNSVIYMNHMAGPKYSFT